MKKALWLVPAAVLLVAIVAIAGCGGSSATGGSGGKSTTSGKVTEASLGVPIYPGATQVDMSAERPSGGQAPPSMNGQSVPTGGQAPPSMNGQSVPTGGGGGPGLQMTALWTKDSVDKVVSWYRDQLKGKSGFKEANTQSGTTTSGNGTGTGGTAFTFTSGNTTKSVMIRKSSQSKGGTVIMIGDMPQGMPSNQGSGQNGPGQTY